jgi:hypothetical protein
LELTFWGRFEHLDRIFWGGQEVGFIGTHPSLEKSDGWGTRHPAIFARKFALPARDVPIVMVL